MLLLALSLATMPRPLKAWSDDLTGVTAAEAFVKPAAVRAELTIDTSGRPVRCDVAVSSTVRTIDKATCSYLMRAARFAPALDPGGAPIAAVVRTDTSFNRPHYAAPGHEADAGQLDFAVQVAGLPARPAPYVADVVLTTTADGKVATCDVGRSSGMAQLDRLACRQVAAMTFAPARDGLGTAVPALRQVSIGFTSGEVPR